MVGLEEWPYGVQVNFNCIPPYGVNGRCIIFGPMMYRAFFYFRIPPYGVNGRFMFFGALWCTGHVFILFRHTV